MFTGIITCTTPILKTKESKSGLTLTFKRPKGWDDIEAGESVSTDGVCLTIASVRKDEYDCFLMPETLKKTSFGISIPKAVNLERSMLASDRFGGHFVQGHVDGLGTIKDIKSNVAYEVFVDFPEEFKNLVVYKGSIAINGVSLTVASVSGSTLSVALIPHTLEHTTLSALKIGDKVNLEFDVIGKYVDNIISRRQ